MANITVQRRQGRISGGMLLYHIIQPIGIEGAWWDKPVEPRHGDLRVQQRIRVYSFRVSGTPPESMRDECYRCGYDLRGIANDGVCPECGLLAERSRRETDELHDSRPQWLRSLSLGIILILIAVVAPIAATVAITLLFPWAINSTGWKIPPGLIGPYLGAIVLVCGTILLTRREGYDPADRADRGARWRLRLVAFIPLIGVLFLHTCYYIFTMAALTFISVEGFLIVIDSIVLASCIFPLLLFLHLRRLAVRARSAHLAEHCMIVGLGSFGSVLYFAALSFVLQNAERWGWRENWWTQSVVAQTLILLMGVSACLFTLWSLYLLVRFAVAFWVAARKLRLKWSRDDRSLAT
jgi:hypothetical protein